MNYQVMHCHNEDCELFNAIQFFKYERTTFHATSEWLEDPECRECGTDCHDHQKEDDE